tara:strand:+ start:320 stop:532 length:213 start_codon:yes stop_codon:yes gene_type:complete
MIGANPVIGWIPICGESRLGRRSAKLIIQCVDHRGVSLALDGDETLYHFTIASVSCFALSSEHLPFLVSN